MPVVEVSPEVWVTFQRTGVRLDVSDEAIDVYYANIPALSRALSIVKESKQYLAWLKREGLA